MIQGVAAKWSFSSLSANKGVNQQVMRFTPFSTPGNLSVKKKATSKVMNLGCSLWYKRVHSLLYMYGLIRTYPKSC